MMKSLQKLETVSKSVVAILTAGTAVLGVLIGIYHGIYKLNQTASNIVKALPAVANNSKFSEINIYYDITLAEKQLIETGRIDRALMRKLISYREEMKLDSKQISSINYLESKTRY